MNTENIKEPLVSVVMIAYNQESFIQKAIDSILCQNTIFPYELIISEDCSTDKTRDICLEYSQKYPSKINLILQKQNIGMIHNFSQAIHLARGRYIAFCEGDDFWTHPQKLQMQCDFLENNSAFSGAYTKVDYVDAENHKIGTSPELLGGFEAIDFNYLVQKNVVHTCSFIFRKDILNNTVYSILDRTPIPDYALFLSTALEGKIAYFQCISAAYRKNAGVSATWTHSNLIKNRLVIYSLFEKYYDLSKFRRSLNITRRNQFFYLFSIPRKGRENLIRLKYLVLLLWYTSLTSFFKPEFVIHEISFFDVIKLIFKSRFRINNWRNYLSSQG